MAVTENRSSHHFSFAPVHAVYDRSQPGRHGIPGVDHHAEAESQRLPRPDRQAAVARCRSRNRARRKCSSRTGRTPAHASRSDAAGSTG